MHTPDSRDMCAEAAGAPTSWQQCLDPRHTAVACSLAPRSPLMSVLFRIIFDFNLLFSLLLCFNPTYLIFHLPLATFCADNSLNFYFILFSFYLMPCICFVLFFFCDFVVFSCFLLSFSAFVSSLC